MNPKEGWRAKDAAHLLGAAGGRDHILIKKMIKSHAGNNVIAIFSSSNLPNTTS